MPDHCVLLVLSFGASETVWLETLCEWTACNCLERFHVFENFFKHKSHFKQLSFMWALALWLRLCLASIQLCGNFFEHTLHSNGLTPLCIRTWLKRWLFWGNRLEQCSQPNGFSPVCVRKCLSRLHRWENLLKQCWRMCDFSPLWFSMCLNKLERWEKNFLHCLQWKALLLPEARFSIVSVV